MKCPFVKRILTKLFSNHRIYFLQMKNNFAMRISSHLTSIENVVFCENVFEMTFSFGGLKPFFHHFFFHLKTSLFRFASTVISKIKHIFTVQYPFVLLILKKGNLFKHMSQNYGRSLVL